MALIQTVHLSMANFKSAPVVPAVQNDTDRQIKMVIDDFNLTAGLTGKITFVRSDGTHYEASATLDTATNSFTADIDQALTQPGRTMVQLKVTDTLTVSTFSFVIFVEEDTSGTVTPQECIDLMQAVEAAEDAADRAESAAETLELDATLTSATKAAQAKAVGDALARTKYNVFNLKNNLVSKLNKNRFDGATFPGYLSATGELTEGSDWVTTGLIYIGDLSAIICSGNTISTGTRSNVGLSFICSYDKDGVFIEQVGTNYAERYTVTTGVEYIRFSYHSDTFNQIQVESGSSRTEYVAYDWSALPDKVDTVETTANSAKEKSDATYPLLDSFKVRSGKNRFNGKTTAGYLNSSGSIVSRFDWVTTDYIYVGDVYEVICSGNNISSGSRSNVGLAFICSYGFDKSFIEQVGTNYGERYIVTSGVAYIRFSYHSEVFNQVQVESGYSRSAYESYYEKPIYALKWFGKNWVAVGDSLTEVNSRSTMRYHDFVAYATGINVVNMGVSGSGYAKKSDTNQAFYQRISSVPISADVITIFGSGNDGSSGLPIGNPTDTGTTTLCGCINTTLDNLFAVLPLANVGIVSPTPWIDQPPTDTTNFMTQYSAALETICKLRGIPFLDLYHCSGLRPWESSYRSLCYSKDEGNGVHPDETGHRLIAPRFEAFLDTLLLH